MNESYDAVVVGGGLVGLSTAYQLVNRGANTLLLDRHDPGRATDAGAGILSPESSTELETWYNFGLVSVRYYDELIPRLQAEQSGETGYSVCGKLLLAVSEDELPQFEESKRVIFDRQARRNDDKEPLRQIDVGEVRALFPAVGAVAGAIYQPQAGRVDGRLLAAAVRRAALGQGLTVLDSSVERLRMEGDQVTGVRTAAGEIFSSAAVIIAGGAWSRTFGEQLGIRIPVEPQRGQIIHLRLPNADTGNWTIINGFRGHYLVPWPDSRVAVGATRESGSGFAPYTTAAGVHEVLGEALRTAPGLADAHLHEIRVGLRPYCVDRLPVLGGVPGVEGVFLATGHGPTGLQLGPYSGKLVADLVLGHPLSTDISPFHVTRFQK